MIHRAAKYQWLKGIVSLIFSCFIQIVFKLARILSTQCSLWKTSYRANGLLLDSMRGHGLISLKKGIKNRRIYNDTDAYNIGMESRIIMKWIVHKKYSGPSMLQSQWCYYALTSKIFFENRKVLDMRRDRDLTCKDDLCNVIWFYDNKITAKVSPFAL